MPRGAPDFYRVTREKAEETEITSFSKLVDAGGTETIYDLPGRDVEIDWLEFATNHRDNILHIIPYTRAGNLGSPLKVVSIDGGLLLDVTPRNIRRSESILWFELVYDEAFENFKFGLGYTIRFGNGIKIQVENADLTNPRTIGVCFQTTVRG